MSTLAGEPSALRQRHGKGAGAPPGGVYPDLSRDEPGEIEAEFEELMPEELNSHSEGRPVRWLDEASAREQEVQSLLASHRAASSSSMAGSIVHSAPPSQQQLTTAGAKRLAELRAKAQLAEIREQQEEAARKAGLGPPAPKVFLVQHRVKPGEDATALAVKYGSTVPQIKAANRKLVFEDILDHIVGEILVIPATRGPAESSSSRPADDAKEVEQREANKIFFATRALREKTGLSAEEAGFYLEEADFDVDRAVQAWKDDMAWEKTANGSGSSGGKSKSKDRPLQPVAAFPSSSQQSGRSTGSSSVHDVYNVRTFNSSSIRA